VVDAGVLSIITGDASSRSVLATTLSGSVRIMIADANGLSVGPFATILCDISTSSHPTEAEFHIFSASYKDLNGAGISGLSTLLTVSFQ